MIRVLISLFLCWRASEAATCGSTEFFEYKFTPIKVAPVNEEDFENAHGRCGTMEKHCEVMIQLYGNKKCKKGESGVHLIAPPDKNVVEGSEFTPTSVGWAGHSQWRLSEAKTTPFSVQVCDKDPAFRGGNDQIIHAQFQDITPGCKNYRHQDENEQHPWFIEYELCCRPLEKGGSVAGGSSFGGGRTSPSRGSTSPTSSFGGGRTSPSHGSFGGGRDTFGSSSGGGHYSGGSTGLKGSSYSSALKGGHEKPKPTVGTNWF